MNTLEKLFGSVARVKLLRLFLLSPERVFASKEAVKILKIKSRAALKEMKLLFFLGVIKKTSRIDQIIKKTSKYKIKTLKIKVRGFQLASGFPFTSTLRNLLITASPISKEKMTKFFRSRGKIKLVVLGGIFAEDLSEFLEEPMNSSKLDLLVVGELKKNKAERFIAHLEAEIGKELNWTVLGMAEFEQRMSMHDKLLRDLFDFPHEFLINKLGLE